MHRGYIKVWRKIKDSGLYQLPNAFTLFMYMLTEAAYKPVRFGTVEVGRGELCTGRHKLSAELEMSEQTIRTAMNHLHELGMITSKPTNKYTVYTIVNYGQYQDVDTLPNQQPNQVATNEQPTNNQPTTTNKEVKKERSKEVMHSSAFLNFWEVWPKSSRKGGKAECWKVWKNKQLDVVVSEIVNHIEYCKTSVWKDPQYIEAPLVYLNKSKWDGADIGVNTGQNFDLNEWMKAK